MTEAFKPNKIWWLCYLYIKAPLTVFPASMALFYSAPYPPFWVGTLSLLLLVAAEIRCVSIKCTRDFQTANIPWTLMTKVEVYLKLLSLFANLISYQPLWILWPKILDSQINDVYWRCWRLREVVCLYVINKWYQSSGCWDKVNSTLKFRLSIAGPSNAFKVVITEKMLYFLKDTPPL